ncbi:MAG: preprotein translocase subunit SecG [Patescibacteria group bacterium]
MAIIIYMCANLANFVPLAGKGATCYTRKIMEILRALVPWIQIILAVAVTIAILLQSNEASLGGVFGGNSSVVHTKRGMEKGLFVITVILASLFIITSIVALLLETF